MSAADDAAVSTQVLFSVAPDYYRCAVQELKQHHRGTVRRVGPDAGILEGGEGIQAQVAGSAHRGEVRFVRHLAAVDAHTKTAAVRDSPEQVADWALAVALERLEPGEAVSLHVWDSGDDSPHPPGKVRRPLLEGLMDHGVRVITSGAERTVSVCVGPERSTAGVGPSSLGLCDWAGGRIRLAARQEQVSRSEFKLEELDHHVGLPSAQTAIDLGASPGGWTRILRSRGVREVHAVDPADLDPRMLRDPGVQHHRQTAGEFVAAFDQRVDLVVNDMRMKPELSASVMLDAAALLHPGGHIIQTLKLGTHAPMRQADHSLSLLEPAYDITFVRQLQHNRHELTVVGTLR